MEEVRASMEDSVPEPELATQLLVGDMEYLSPEENWGEFFALLVAIAL